MLIIDENNVLGDDCASDGYKSLGRNTVSAVSEGGDVASYILHEKYGPKVNTSEGVQSMVFYKYNELKPS